MCRNPTEPCALGALDPRVTTEEFLLSLPISDKAQNMFDIGCGGGEWEWAVDISVHFPNGEHITA